MTRIAVPNSSRRRAPRLALALVLLILLVFAGLALWTWASLAWAYSDGDRAGALQKFSRKGWVCKTYEGEIALYYGGGQYLGPGSSPQLWDFSVRDPAVAVQLAKAVGHRVQLHFTEHRGLPTSCFAETSYFVDRFVDEQAASPAQAPQATPSGPASPAPQPLPDVRPGATVMPPPPPQP